MSVSRPVGLTSFPKTQRVFFLRCHRMECGAFVAASVCSYSFKAEQSLSANLTKLSKVDIKKIMKGNWPPDFLRGLPRNLLIRYWARVGLIFTRKIVDWVRFRYSLAQVLFFVLAVLLTFPSNILSLGWRKGVKAKSNFYEQWGDLK